ncbi:MAG: aminotransferase class I/II-fold pyridoxal phosphate-dependent enzyme [Fimbriimonadaceae bacterium]|nr:aminotransferase class I/II-fold pyridoxal phosphate-dependent enzyme [Alphaproteobacteria bacterium]
MSTNFFANLQLGIKIMNVPPEKLAALSAQDKRELLEKLLKEREQDSTSSESGGFRFPPDYAALKQQFEGQGEAGVSDLFFQSFDGINSSLAEKSGSKLINYCSYNYLNMSGDPLVSKTAIEAIETYGTSVSASRLVSGERPIHQELETALARWIGAEDAIVFVGGFSTNEDTIGHLMAEGDLVLYDSLIHISVQKGAQLSGATALPFPHNNFEALENILHRRRKDARQVLIVVEGVYSMDGDIPDLPRLIDIKNRHDALLMVDEAHSMGVLGATGRGIGEYFNVAAHNVDVWMGTLSKTLASCGGYIAGSRELITYLRHTAPGFVYSVGVSPPLAAAALTALRIIENEPVRVAQLHKKVRLFHGLTREKGLDTGSASIDAAVIPILTGDTTAGILLSRDLMKQGILVLPIGFPAVPENKARLRFFVSSSHKEEEIRKTVDAVSLAMKTLRIAER